MSFRTKLGQVNNQLCLNEVKTEPTSSWHHHGNNDKYYYY
jgi:hypothetical protein